MGTTPSSALAMTSPSTTVLLEEPGPRESMDAGSATLVRRAVAVALLAIVVSALPIALRKALFGFHPRRPVGWVVLLGLGVLMLSWKPLMRTRRRRFIGVLLALSVGLRLAAIAAIPNPLVSDFAIFQELALSLLSGHGYAITGPVGMEDLELYLRLDPPLPYTTAFRPPGAALWAAALYRVFGTDPVVFKIANAVLGSLIAVLLYALLAGRDEAVARSSALLWSLYPSAIFATNLVGTEILFTFLLMALALLLSARRRTYGQVGAAGLVAALAVLVRALLGPLIVAALLVCGRGQPRRRRLAKCLVFLLALGVGLAPWTIRNWRRFHRFIPTCTNEGRAAADHTGFDLPDSPQSRRWLDEWTAASLDEAERSARGYGVAVKNLQEMLRGGTRHTLSCLRRNISWLFGSDENMVFWSTRRDSNWAPDDRRPAMVGPRRYNLLAFGASSFYAVVLGAATFSIFSRSAAGLYQAAGVLFLAAFFAINTFVYALVPAVNRYHFPLMPFLLILAAAASRDALRAGREALGRLRQRSYRPAGEGGATSKATSVPSS
jgi:dolichyl-phosphate-mannose-protein mannosyltransferase